MSGSALVVGLSNSGFELLTGIAPRCAGLHGPGLRCGCRRGGDVGDRRLAFIAFPTIVNGAPAGAVIGVLFFASLVMAGFTSLVSVLEVVISAVRDKFETSRVRATLVADPVRADQPHRVQHDEARDLRPGHRRPLHQPVRHPARRGRQHGRHRVGRARPAPAQGPPQPRRARCRCAGWWIALVSVVTPPPPAFILVRELLAVIEEPYGATQWMLVVFGWLAALVAVAGFAIARVPWRPETSLDVGDDPRTTPPQGASREHPAIVMLVVSVLVIWGGLLFALLHLRRVDREDAIEQEMHRDL